MSLELLLVTPGLESSLFNQSLLEKVSGQVKEDSLLSSSLSLAKLAKSGGRGKTSSSGSAQGVGSSCYSSPLDYSRPGPSVTGRGPFLPLVAVVLSGVVVAGACLLLWVPIIVFGSRSHVPVPWQSASVCHSTDRRGVTGGESAAVGVSYPLLVRSSTVLGAHPLSFLQPLVHQGQSSGMGSSFPCGEGCGQAGPPFLSRLLQPIVCGDEGLRVVEACHRSFHFELLCPQISVQV